MIPSLINLMIGGASFIRGVPGLPALLLRFMPAGKAVPPFDRQWLALVLTSQVFLGAILGIAAQAFLAMWLSSTSCRGLVSSCSIGRATWRSLTYRCG
jgi:hypothetical protein